MSMRMRRRSHPFREEGRIPNAWPRSERRGAGAIISFSVFPGLGGDRIVSHSVKPHPRTCMLTYGPRYQVSPFQMYHYRSQRGRCDPGNARGMP